jgi:hypothetical protein
LPFLYGHALLNQHGRNEGRLGKAPDKLDGMLDNRGIRRIWRHEPQADVAPHTSSRRRSLRRGLLEGVVLGDTYLMAASADIRTNAQR